MPRTAVPYLVLQEQLLSENEGPKYLGATMKKFIDQCSCFEHTMVLNREPVEFLKDRCYTKPLVFVTQHAKVF